MIRRQAGGGGMEWPRVPLDRIADDMQPGFACQPTNDDHGIPQLRTNNVSSEGHIDLAEVKRVPATESQRERYALRQGDVLFNNTNSPTLVGKTALFDGDGLYLFSNHMTRVRLDLALANPGFVARYLHWAWMQGMLRGLVTQWVSQAAINRGQLGGVLIPLPPLSEQRRIVEILDQADRLRRLHAEADAKEERILPALFIKMFGDPATNPMGWPERKVGEVCQVVSGATPKTNRSEFWGGGIAWATPKDLSALDDWVLETTERAITAEGLASCSATVMPADAVLLSSRAPIGLVALAGAPMCTNQGFKSLVCSANVEPWYLFAWCKLRLSFLQSLGRGATFKEVSKRIVEEIRIPLPPMREQRRFGRRLEQIRLIRQRERLTRQLVARLFDQLLALAFCGSLTVTWREAHMKELLQEIKGQADAFGRAAEVAP